MRCAPGYTGWSDMIANLRRLQTERQILRAGLAEIANEVDDWGEARMVANRTLRDADEARNR